MIRTSRRGAIAAATAVTLLALVSGCSGFVSGSMADNIENPASGNNAQAGKTLVRNAFVLGPPQEEIIPRGGKAALYVSLFNDRNAPDAQTERLVGASASIARSVRISGGSVTVPPQELVNVSVGTGKIVLRGLTKELSGGESVKVTLMFELGGKATFTVPVLPQTGPYATLTPLPEQSLPTPSGRPSPTGNPPVASLSPTPTTAGEGQASPEGSP